MIIKIIKLLLKLDLKIKLSKNYDLNLLYDNFLTETNWIFEDMETDYYLKDL